MPHPMAPGARQRHFLLFPGTSTAVPQMSTWMPVSPYSPNGAEIRVTMVLGFGT